MERNFTTGSIGKNVAVFSLPYFLTYFLQALYGLADMYFIGRYNGADVITAVSVGSQLMHMITVMIVGFSVATTVTIGHGVGAGDKKKITDTINSSIVLFTGIAVVTTALLLITVSPIVEFLKTPSVSVEETKAYLRICFGGIPFIVAYNVIAAIYRGLGDSRTPLYFVSVAAAVNIILDYLLVGPMEMKAAGAAIATIAAQAAAVVFALVFMRMKRKPGDSIGTGIKPGTSGIGGLAKIGLPVMLQEGFIQVSFIIITIIANSRGEEIAAAVGIVEKIITFVFLVNSTMMSTTASLCAQNLGAGYTARAKKVMFYCMSISFSIGMLFFIVSNICPTAIVGQFTSDSNVTIYAAQYLRSYSIDCAFAAVHFCFSGYFNALGISIATFAHNAISIVTTRIPGTYLASIKFPSTLLPMGIAAPAGSLLSIFICLGIYLWHNKKEKAD